MPMEDYLAWKRDDGLPVDDWLRVHARLGGRFVRVCPRSFVVEDTITEWREWTGMEFPTSGEYIVPGALVPVAIDLAADREPTSSRTSGRCTRDEPSPPIPVTEKRAARVPWRKI